MPRCQYARRFFAFSSTEVSRVFGCMLFALLASSVSQGMVPFGAESRYDTAEHALGSHTLNVVFIQDDLLRHPSDVTHPESDSGQIIRRDSLDG